MLLSPLRLYATNSHKCMARPSRRRSTSSRHPVLGLLGLTCCLSSSALWAVAESSVSQTIIACVGDSITYSGGGKDYVSYPQNLQNALGPSFKVLNFGQSGATASPTNEQYSTAFRDLYNDALESNAHVFVIQLGTNDAKTRYWNATIYRSSMHAFLDSFKQLPQSPYLMLGVPPPYVEEDDSWHEPATNPINTQLPIIISEIANERGIPYVNHFKAFGGFENFNEQFYFLPGDGIHPNPLGYERIAWEVYQELKAAFFTNLTYAPTNCPTLSPIKGPSISHSPSYLPTVMPIPIPTLLPSYAPSYVPTPAQPLTSTPTHRPAVGPSVMPTHLPSPMPPISCPTFLPTTKKRSHNPTPQPIVVPSSCPTDEPTPIPVPIPTVLPSISPSISPSLLPSESPSLLPTVSPTILSSASPSLRPSAPPSLRPSASPSPRPSALPSHPPSVSPSLRPSVSPTLFPSLRPSIRPSNSPSHSPSHSPSLRPTTVGPSRNPTAPPMTASPSRNPSTPPTTVMPTTARPSTSAPISSDAPFQSPTPRTTMSQPSSAPSFSPSLRPTTVSPSARPTNYPSMAPTPTPSEKRFGFLTYGPSAIPTFAESRLPSGFPTFPTLGPSTIFTEVPTTPPSAMLRTTVGTAILSGIPAASFGAAEAGAFESSVIFLLNLGGRASVIVLVPYRSGGTPSTATSNRRLDVSTTVTFEILAPAPTASIGEALQVGVENGIWTKELRIRGNETALVDASVTAVDVDFTHQPSNAPAISPVRSSASASLAIWLILIIVICAVIFVITTAYMCAIRRRCTGGKTHKTHQSFQLSDHGNIDNDRQECDDESRMSRCSAAALQQIRAEFEDRAPSEKGIIISSTGATNELSKEDPTRKETENLSRTDRTNSSSVGSVSNVESPMPTAVLSNPRDETLMGSSKMTTHKSTSLRANTRNSWAQNSEPHAQDERLDDVRECQLGAATGSRDHSEAHHQVLHGHKSEEGEACRPVSTRDSDNRPLEVASTNCCPEDVNVALPGKSDDQSSEHLPFAPYNAEFAEALSLLNQKPHCLTAYNGMSPESVEVEYFDGGSEFSSPTQLYHRQPAA